MSQEKAKTCLIVTYGPVPTAQYQTVEGGGMRVWGLAKGLSAHGLQVSVAVNDSFPQNIRSHENIKLLNWSLNDQFIELINSYDSVVISYCLGDPSVFVANNINDDVQLILDVYVPIHVEVSARESDDIETELRNYLDDIQRFNIVLKRGDYFLCANNTQKIYYTGILSSLGVLNPRSYHQERILVVPFGIHNEPVTASHNPYEKLGLKNSDFIVLWFGGLYPWFRVEELLGAMLDLSDASDIKFVFVGGKNPFNNNPDFVKQYEKVLAFSKEHKLFEKTVYFVDWVDFNDRINWYVHANLVISLNKPGEENSYSWRTRVMDYVWGEMPILTNGGDPLSEDLINNNAAIRLNELSETAIAKSIKEAYGNPQNLKKIKSSVTSLKPAYYWEEVAGKIIDDIKKGRLPYLDEQSYKRKVKIIDKDLSAQPLFQEGAVNKLLRMPVKIIAHARRKGLKRSAQLGINVIKTQLKQKATKPQKQFIFISHPMEHTGAPMVLMQIIEEFVKEYGPNRVRLVAPFIAPDYRLKLIELGVRIDKAALGISFRLIRLQLGLRKDDFVLMNTVAIYDNYREFIMLWLKTGRLKHAYWFIHEDKAQLPVISREFVEGPAHKRIEKMIKDKKLKLFVPSERTKKDYNKLFHTNSVQAIPLKVEVDEKYKAPRPSKAYQSIDFLISGTPGDGRKGQLLALPAFYYFIKNYYEKDPEQYRPFKLRLIAIGDDYISRQIRWVGDSLLKKHLIIYAHLERKEALAVTHKCNVVICCSLNETFNLSIAEGMCMGHVVLRNNTAGVDEQLKENVNGYFIDHTDIAQFARQIEKILNKKTSNQVLKKMGIASQQMVAKYNDNSYLSEIQHRS